MDIKIRELKAVYSQLSFFANIVHLLICLANFLGENTFYVKIGPTGGAKGYSKITGLPSWGTCYYINDLLIPELFVERGQTYRFVVETGESQTNPARYMTFISETKIY